MYEIALLLKDKCRDFSGGPKIDSLPCSAGDAGSIPRWGTKILQAVEQESLCATTKEPMCHDH